MALSENTAVRAAYEAGWYTDTNGLNWRRGMDGWFLDNVDGKGGVMLSYHHDMVAMMEKEHPEPFDCNDNVQGFIDGFGMCKGYIIDIDPDSEFPYMIRTTEGEYHVFEESELETWDGTK